MKTITIRVPDVEAAMLVEVQKRNKAFANIKVAFAGWLKNEYKNTSRLNKVRWKPRRQITR